jgi:type IV secretion system protein VirB1
MSLTLAAALLLAQDCAPQVAPATLLSIATVESQLDPLAIGVNGRPWRSLRPGSKAEAVRVAARLIASGASADLGLAQINSRNLAWLGLSLEDAFDPCRNLAAAAKVLVASYSADRAGEPQVALRAALSRYNTGDAAQGLRNGYVAKVAAAAEHIVPALKTSAETAEDRPSSAQPPPPAWDVFARQDAEAVMVFSAARDIRRTPFPSPNSQEIRHAP